MQLHLPTPHVCVVTTIFEFTLTVHGTLLHLYHIEFSLVHTLGIASQDTNNLWPPYSRAVQKAGLSKKHFSLFGGHQNSLQGLSKICVLCTFRLSCLPQYLYCLSFCYNVCKFLHNFFIQFCLFYLSGINFNPLIASLSHVFPLASQSRQFGKNTIFLILLYFS